MSGRRGDGVTTVTSGHAGSPLVVSRSFVPREGRPGRGTCWTGAAFAFRLPEVTGFLGRAERVYALTHVRVLPETGYARSGDLMIAYQVVIAPGTVSHLDLELEYWPDVVREYESIAR